MKLKECIKQVENKRTIQDLSAYRVCKLAGVDVTHYYHWRNGQANRLSDAKINEIRRVLKLKPVVIDDRKRDLKHEVRKNIDSKLQGTQKT